MNSPSLFPSVSPSPASGDDCMAGAQLTRARVGDGRRTRPCPACRAPMNWEAVCCDECWCGLEPGLRVEFLTAGTLDALNACTGRVLKALGTTDNRYITKTVRERLSTARPDSQWQPYPETDELLGLYLLLMMRGRVLGPGNRGMTEKEREARVDELAAARVAELRREPEKFRQRMEQEVAEAAENLHKRTKGTKRMEGRQMGKSHMLPPAVVDELVASAMASRCLDCGEAFEGNSLWCPGCSSHR